MNFNFNNKLLRRSSVNRWPALLPLLLAVLCLAPRAAAQDKPYFVTYDHHLEEPGNLEISLANTLGVPRSGQPVFSAPLLELEYGVKAWWTAEFYLEGQSRQGD